MTAVRVHLDTETGPVVVGTAYITRLRGTTTTQFTYEDRYLAGHGWAISPDLPPMRRDARTEGLPGALDDSAPDAWGCNLIMRHLASEARAGGQVAPAPTEVDFLLGVNDHTRQGALRFSLGDDPTFLADGGEVPRLLDLERLLEATRRVTQDDGDAGDAVTALLDAGSGSLGGARPKASVVDGDRLFIAKFPHLDDQWDVMAWEGVALDLAAACGLRTPPHRLLRIGGATVLMVERFDRQGLERIPFLSARSLIGQRDDTAGDYLELVEALTEHGSMVNADLVELWRRIAFSIAINNTDDHLRNHAFLWKRNGWALSPIFDVNPNPATTASRSTSIAGATAPTDSRAALFSSARRFNIDPFDAERYWAEILGVIAGWRDTATALEIPEPAQRQLEPALDRWRP